MGFFYRLSLFVVALAILCLAQIGGTFAQNRDALNDAVRAVIQSLPMFGRSTEAQNAYPYEDALKSSYYGEGDAGMLGLPISEPAKATFKISWSVEPTSIRATPEEREAAYNNWTAPCLGKNVNPGTLGLDTCVGSNAEAGANDPNFSADPYLASGTAAAVRVCATVWVQATLGASPDGSHGARNRPEVMQAMETIARNFAQSAATELIRAVDSACGQEVQTPEDPGGGEEKTDRLEASVSCDSSTIVISQLPSLNCHIIFTSWIRNSSYPVQVSFPGADGFGNHANGIQIAQGGGTEYVNNWDGPPHSWGMFVFACPAMQNTGANCYSSVTTPGEVSVLILITQGELATQLTLTLTAVPNPNGGGGGGGGSPVQANLNQVFVNGYYFATTDVGLQVGMDRSAIATAVNGMRQSAASSGVIPVDGFDRLAGLVSANVDNAQLAQEVYAQKTQVSQITNRQCQNNLNLYSIWVMGYYASSAELGAQYGLDKGWLISQLNELRNAAAATSMPLGGIDQVLAALNAGQSQQQTQPAIVAIKNDFVQRTNYIYQCN